MVFFSPRLLWNQLFLPNYCWTSEQSRIMHFYGCPCKCYISLMQSADSLYGFGYTFWTFWIIALHLLYKLWISNILATSMTEKTCFVEMRIWCRKIGTVNVIINVIGIICYRTYTTWLFLPLLCWRIIQRW